jgi:catechol 2,3-dioxygenase-like lactoylglutathione lyase family enzyme
MTTQNATAASAMENQKSVDTNADHKDGTALTTNSIDKPKTELKHEIVVIPASDPSRAKEFYGRLGWRLDTDLDTGDGPAQHLARLMGRSRALEVTLSADDYDAELAERYGWINRALPHDALDEFVRSLAHRIAKFPPAGRTAVKERVNAMALASKDDSRRDSDLFGEGIRNPEAEKQIQAALKAASKRERQS